jgi:fucose 4-O-acetylase-like acetyltransferase
MHREQYWNIVKGLGMIAIVFWHAGSPVTPYVYMYHVALFFFVSGYLYVRVE